MVQSKFRLPRLSARTKTLLAIAIIIIVTVLAVLYAPPEGESNNTTGDLPYTPTVSVTNMISSLTVNRQATLQSMQLTVTQVTEASGFSDDRRRGGTYVIRVDVLAKNEQNAVVGVNYESLVRLQLPDGTLVAPKFISLHPVALPKSVQSGVFDFPISNPVPLSSLTIHFGTESTVAFSERVPQTP
jgi:hypothetical protein